MPKLADEGHGVGGELSAARARSRTRGIFQCLEPRVGHSAMRMAADCFINVDGDGMAFKFSGSDGTAVTRNIQARGAMMPAGMVLSHPPRTTSASKDCRRDDRSEDP